MTETVTWYGCTVPANEYDVLPAWGKPGDLARIGTCAAGKGDPWWDPSAA